MYYITNEINTPMCINYFTYTIFTPSKENIDNIEVGVLLALRQLPKMAVPTINISRLAL